MPERIGSAGDRASFWPETLFVESEVPVALNDHWDETPEGLLSASGLFHENIHYAVRRIMPHGQVWRLLCLLLAM
ncbi:hypothetical protein, partial [Sinorhizobium medicae]|uniref:hypothetical protein n=1 Tax=Sinorhizobium medicae TaxID=110321 RepID=UPI001AEE4681